jgi:hypothetical protein
MIEITNAASPNNTQSTPMFSASPTEINVSATKSKADPYACVGLAPIYHLLIEN